MVNVYSPCALSAKKSLWEELTNAKLDSQELAWCVCGDFNAVRSRSERKGIGRGDQSREMNGFNSFIESNSLLDLPLVGKLYTWFKPDGTAKSRIDRALVTEEWLQQWPMSRQYVLRREVSDHCALVIKFVEKDWGPKPFRSIDAWFLERGFNNMVKVKWKSYSVQGNGIWKLKEKLKLLKIDLKSWNKDVFGNLHTTKGRVVQELEELDCEDCNGGLEESERLKRMELTSRLVEIDRKIDSLLCQKARASWFKYGDSCTRFYHSSLRWRRLRNEVKGVQLGGFWCEESSTVRLKPDSKVRRISGYSWTG